MRPTSRASNSTLTAVTDKSESSGRLPAHIGAARARSFLSPEHRISAQRAAAIDGNDGASGERKILHRGNDSGGNLIGRCESLQRRAFELLIAPSLVHRFYEIRFDEARRNRYDTNFRSESARQRLGHI